MNNSIQLLRRSAQNLSNLIIFIAALTVSQAVSAQTSVNIPTQRVEVVTDPCITASSAQSNNLDRYLSASIPGCINTSRTHFRAGSRLIAQELFNPKMEYGHSTQFFTKGQNIALVLFNNDDPANADLGKAMDNATNIEVNSDTFDYTRVGSQPGATLEIEFNYNSRNVDGLCIGVRCSQPAAGGGTVEARDASAVLATAGSPAIFGGFIEKPLSALDHYFQFAGLSAEVNDWMEFKVDGKTLSSSLLFNYQIGQSYNVVIPRAPLGGNAGNAVFALSSAGAFGSSVKVFNVPKVDNSTVPAVPEPATWALMLLGFFAVGRSMRGRKVGFKGLQTV